jgi:hypothetical protein
MFFFAFSFAILIKTTHCKKTGFQSEDLSFFDILNIILLLEIGSLSSLRFFGTFSVTFSQSLDGVFFFE